ncbi:MAG TPA: hypothetical protein VE934_09060 [Polaromonas sp.]|uniref:hypothetical protein n=1 Tax=Polaromonas sp. TaxID=1869339 RepID=UPI002D653532|nr:hypothetical protein [Polaromonas sp.]HYW57098.1 hypothetical protein [Polaromonas sp.]
MSDDAVVPVDQAQANSYKNSSNLLPLLREELAISPVSRQKSGPGQQLVPFGPHKGSLAKPG